MHHGLVLTLYADALLLADEARAWFDRARIEADQSGAGQPEPNRPETGRRSGDAILSRAEADPVAVKPDAIDADSILAWPGHRDAGLRIALSCESLRLTTRLMHVIAWLLLQRAVIAGELAASVALEPDNRLGQSPACDAVSLTTMPEPARRLIEASVRLHDRAAALEASLTTPQAATPPEVLAMFGRLQAVF